MIEIKQPPCQMHSVTFRTTGDTNDWSEGGRYPWRDKVYPGYWPVVWGWAFQGPLEGDEAGISPLVAVSFIQTQDLPATGAACNWQIFADLIPIVDVVPPNIATPSAVNTNFGAGWIVPAMDGLPMDLLVVIDKTPGGGAPEPYSACFNFMWSYEKVGELR